MVGIFKTNDIETIGGTTPQGDGIKLVGTVGDWTVVDVADHAISSVQEFNIHPVADDFATSITGPQQEGAFNEEAKKINSFGDKMRYETNPSQVIIGVDGVSDGTKLVSPDEMDTESKKNFTSEDVKAYKVATEYIKKYDAKSVLRNQIRGNIIDIEDDIADTKTALQAAIYYMVYEWNNRTDAEKEKNPSKNAMDALSAKLLSDEVKMRVDLADGINKLNTFLETEEKINTFVTEQYTYNSERGN